MRTIDAFVVHCTATQVNATIEAIKKGWKNKGWKNPGYHYIVTENEVVSLLGEEFISNGVGNGNYGLSNKNTINIAYIGGLDKDGNICDTRTDTQKKLLFNLIKGLSKKYPGKKVLGHRDLSPDLDDDGVIEPNEWIKVCPAFDVKSWLLSYNMGALFAENLLKNK